MTTSPGPEATWLFGGCPKSLTEELLTSEASGAYHSYPAACLQLYLSLISPVEELYGSVGQRLLHFTHGLNSRKLPPILLFRMVDFLVLYLAFPKILCLRGRNGCPFLPCGYLGVG